MNTHQSIHKGYVEAMNSLERKFKTMAPGNQLTYQEIQDNCGFDVREHGSIMRGVKDRLRKYHGKIITNIRNFGFKICTDVEVLDILDRMSRNGEKKYKTQLEMINTVNPSSMGKDDQKRTITKKAHITTQMQLQKLLNSKDMGNYMLNAPDPKDIIKLLTK